DYYCGAWDSSLSAIF
nr:immunoglobulin light chain junction region [Macaca mulatta]